MGSTVSYVSAGDRTRTRFRAPYVVLLLESSRPTAPSARFSIAEVEEVSLGRGARRGHRRTTFAGKGLLRLDVPDPWMSGDHARLVRDGTTWTVVDAGSKNGTYLAGERLTCRRLHDGDIVEIGGTFVLFRNAVERRFDDVLDVSAADLASLPPAQQTLSVALRGDLDEAGRVAASDAPILLGGETGTGKELTARLLHDLSGRRGPFVAINCGALTRTLVESELFGHVAGAFSGAARDRPGLIREADGGTLFLDEVAELPEATQAALLRVLAEGEVSPVGASRPVTVDVRVVAATHQDLEQRVAEGTFRRDLFARLAGFRLTLPPLRERREDLGLLTGNLLRVLAPAPDAVSFQRGAVRALMAHAWPMNIRELGQRLRAALPLCGDEAIAPEHLRLEPVPTSAAPTPSSEDEALRAELVRLLEAHDGNISAVARAMGKARVQIRRWCKRVGLDPARYRGPS